jgi:ABC-type glutathione transport system ATPase component
MQSALIRIENLSKSYGRHGKINAGAGGVTKVIDDLSLEIITGECLALIGGSGGGKSTLGRCILRLVEPDSGRVFFNGMSLLSMTPGQFRKERPKLQMIFQDSSLALNPKMTVAATLTEPLRVLFELSKETARERAEALLASVALPPDFLNRMPGELSGGQRQRVAIARALATKPEFLVADEPTSSLDCKNKGQIIELLKGLQVRHNLTLLLMSHDLSMVYETCDRIAVMQGGQIVEIAPTQEFFDSPRHHYSKALIAAAVGQSKSPAIVQTLR